MVLLSLMSGLLNGVRATISFSVSLLVVVIGRVIMSLFGGGETTLAVTLSLVINSVLAALHIVGGSAYLSVTLLVRDVDGLPGNLSHVGGEVAPGSCLSVRLISSVNVGTPHARLSLTPVQVGDVDLLPGGGEAALISPLSVRTVSLGGEAALHAGGLPVSDFSSVVAPAESKAFL